MGSNLNMIELSPQTLEKAFLELNEQPQQRQNAITELRHRIQLQSKSVLFVSLVFFIEFIGHLRLFVL